ncbi:MAG: alpha-L-rhamnosidase C-terminal domain-containing protein, partial [Planctomycetota bacterium]
CSVYGAQYLLEALYRNGEADYALSLMTAKHDRGWWNMMAVGSTITLEAWDWKYKNNLDWNHAWGAAPANIVGRYLLGVRPLEPGFRKVLIHPQLGPLGQASGKVPTPKGPVTVSVNAAGEQGVTLELELPAEMTARVGVPASDPQAVLMVDGSAVEAERVGETLFVDSLGPGAHTMTTCQG